MSEPTAATILIVDDTEASRYAVSRILRKAGYAVREAGTGAEALRLAAEGVDLIVLDVQLPDINGYEVCQRLKANAATARTMVLHLSASFVRSEDRSEGLESGADGYLTYPLEPRELLANVQALLRVRQAERATWAQRELLRVTLGSIGDGVIATDLRGVVTFINLVAQELTGWSEQEAVGKPVKEIFNIFSERTDEPVRDPVEQVIRSGQTAGLGHHTWQIGRDGTRRSIDDIASPIRDENGQFVGVVLVFRDITERRAMEAELQRRAEAMLERDRRKDEFLAMLAHELRNPLSPLTNTVQYLTLRLADNPEFQLAAGVLERQLTHLTRLVDDLLDVSRITQGKFELRRQRIELQEIVARAVELAQHRLQERQHQLKVVLPARSISLDADPDRLEQMLNNLLTNAAKYTPPGGQIQLTAASEGNQVVIRVLDNGIGIRPEMLPRLFEMFQQADRVPGRVSEGLGLGLALVRSLAEMHGGSAGAVSRGPGHGSEFIIRLPVLAEDRTHPVGATTTQRQPSSGRGLRILVVDDSVDGAVSLAALLRAEGHAVQIAHDGPAALATARTFLPEVVVMDICLPQGMDGYEVARRLLEQTGPTKPLLIALTGYGQLEDRRRSGAAGFHAHLVKPVDLTILRDLLAQRQQD